MHRYVPEERLRRSKDRRRLKQQSRRREQGSMNRLDYLATSKSRLKPWVAEGISRATWYHWPCLSPFHPSIRFMYQQESPGLVLASAGLLAWWRKEAEGCRLVKTSDPLERPPRAVFLLLRCMSSLLARLMTQSGHWPLPDCSAEPLRCPCPEPKTAVERGRYCANQAARHAPEELRPSFGSACLPRGSTTNRGPKIQTRSISCSPLAAMPK